jgi:hypothetical protein
MIAKDTSSATYSRTKPEQCFVTMAGAIANGYCAARD